MRQKCVNQRVARPSIIPMPEEQRPDFKPEEKENEWVPWFFAGLLFAGASWITYAIYHHLLAGVFHLAGGAH